MSCLNHAKYVQEHLKPNIDEGLIKLTVGLELGEALHEFHVVVDCDGILGWLCSPS